MPSVPNESRQFFAQLLESTQHKNLGKGNAIHARIVKSARSSCPHLGNSLVNLYAKCGDLRRARLVFDNLAKKDIVSWNCLINATCASHKNSPSSSAAAMELLRRMRRENAAPNAHTFSAVFTAAATDVLAGRQSHAAAIKSAGFGDVFVGSSLLNLYCKVGSVSDARKVFDEIPVRNLVSWATMISGYSEEGMETEALGLFGRLRREEKEFETEFVLTSVLKSLTSPGGALTAGRQIHCLAVKNGLSSFVPVGNSLVTMYAKCNSLTDAVRVFESSDKKNTITWSAMVTGSVQNGEPQTGLKLFSEMHFSGTTPSEFALVATINACSDNGTGEQGKQLHGYSIKSGFGSHIYASVALLNMYANHGEISEARKVFDHSRPNSPDCALWTSMIGAEVIGGDHEAALSLYREMQAEGVDPNELTAASALKACSSLAALGPGRQVHASAAKLGLGLNLTVGTALSTMYARCGDPESAQSAFSKLPNKDAASWNAMISGLARSGGEEALRVFGEMVSSGEKPGPATFVGVLSWCSHRGAADQARWWFDAMERDFGVEPMVEHHACVVDALGRAGRVREAREFIESGSFDRDPRLWRVLLGGCRRRGDCDVGVYAGERLVEMGSRESSDYVLLSGVYAREGWREEVERVRRMMRERGVSKEPGCSWVELGGGGGGVHVFVTSDELHPRIQDVRLEIRRLRLHMKDQYYFDPNF